ncbi:MAG: PD-(D/E)XK nuclease family protein [Solirubrobacterales bacterium]
MPLTIIKGPPNSGRTEQVRQRYLELLPERPVLVVPGVDDIFGWERRLTAETGALLGGQIVHFKDLFGEILEIDHGSRPRLATELQRIHFMREAIKSEWRSVAGRLPDQPGLVDSVLQLVDDFRTELVDVETLAERIESADLGYLRNLTSVYGRYIEILVQREGLTDAPAEARRALDRVAVLWGKRPVMIVGFDELTRLQLEMVSRLAFRVGTEVIVAVTHEEENPALALTDRLVSDLKQLGPENQIVEKTTSRDDELSPHDPQLVEIERRFMRNGSGDLAPLEASDVLTFLKSTGQRNEAEAIGAEIAKLLDSGVDAGQIAIATEVPAQSGRIIRDTLERFDIPVTLEAETPVGSTVVGETLLNLIEAGGPTDSSSAFLAFLRSPVGPPRAETDRLERDIRRREISSARAAAALIAETSELPRLWQNFTTELDLDRPVAEQIANGANEIAMALLEGETGSGLPASIVTETQASTAIAKAVREVAAFEETGTGLEMITDALRSPAVKVWAVPASDTVRIASPYSLRAKRVEYLFYASLQESGLVDTDRAGPFLSVNDRKALLMSEHRDPEIQQRYLFYSSISVPTKRLWLSCRNSDETGKAEHPSPLIASVEELFSKDTKENPIVTRGGRSGSEITFQPGAAPSEVELSRSLAADRKAPRDAVAGSDLESALADSLVERLEEAATTEERTRGIASITLAPILAALGERTVLSATEIEAYAGCPYRWFIEKQLNPAKFDPDPDYLSTGTLLHDTLEGIYRDHPGEIPRAATIDEWLAEVPERVDRAARKPGIGLGSETVSHAAIRSRATQLVSAHLLRESKWEDPLHLPQHLEFGFGTGKAQHPAVPMGDWSLKGKVDRVDLSPATGTEVPRTAVVIDYKSGAVTNLTHKKSRKERKFQVQLYLRAVQEILSDEDTTVETVAGIYVPIRFGGEQSRGAFSGDAEKWMVDRGVSSVDKVKDFAEFIEQGIEAADEAAIRLMKGILQHDSATCPNHFDHPAVPGRSSGDAAETPAGGFG